MSTQIRHQSRLEWHQDVGSGVGAEVLNLEGGGFASFSPVGTRLMTLSPNKPGSVLIYDSRPANRAFPRFSVAPRPRVKP